MIRGIVFTHMDLGKAFCETLESLLGPQEDLIGLSNRDLNAEQMLEILEDHVGPVDKGVVAFTALFGGSCWQTAERLCRERPDLKHITGVNLPMLIAFVNKRDSTGLEELAVMLTDYGHRGIKP